MVVTFIHALDFFTALASSSIRCCSCTFNSADLTTPAWLTFSAFLSIAYVAVYVYHAVCACIEYGAFSRPPTTCSAEAIRSIARSLPAAAADRRPAPFAWALLPANRDDGTSALCAAATTFGPRERLQEAAE